MTTVEAPTRAAWTTPWKPAPNGVSVSSTGQ